MKESIKEHKNLFSRAIPTTLECTEQSFNAQREQTAKGATLNEGDTFCFRQQFSRAKSESSSIWNISEMYRHLIKRLNACLEKSTRSKLHANSLLARRLSRSFTNSTVLLFLQTTLLLTGAAFALHYHRCVFALLEVV